LRPGPRPGRCTHQGDRRGIQADDPAAGIDGDDGVGRALEDRGQRRLLVEQLLDAGEDLLTRERLLHEVVGADAAAEELFRRLFVAAHHDHRHLMGQGVLAQGAQGGKAVHAGQHDVEKDQFRPAVAGQFQAAFRIQGLQGHVAGRLEHLAQGGDDGPGVVDDQHPGALACIPPLPPTPFGERQID